MLTSVKIWEYIPKMSSALEALLIAVAKLLRPLIRILQHNGVPYTVFADLAKRTYVEVAEERFALPERKQSISRLSILTGLTRKEVMRVLNLAPTNGLDALARYNRAARVIAGWVRDEDFNDQGGEPLALPLQSEDQCNFTELVRRYSGDMPARAMLDELERVGAVEYRNQHVRLLCRAYIPRVGESEKFGILGSDVADLIGTIDHNVYGDLRNPRFQRKVAYDNLPAESIPSLRALSRDRAQALIEDLDREFARADRDINKAQRGRGRIRAGVGIYYFEENLKSNS